MDNVAEPNAIGRDPGGTCTDLARQGGLGRGYLPLAANADGLSAFLAIPLQDLCEFVNIFS